MGDAPWRRHSIKRTAWATHDRYALGFGPRLLRATAMRPSPSAACPSTDYEAMGAVLVADNPGRCRRFPVQPARPIDCCGFLRVTKLYHPDDRVSARLATWETTRTAMTHGKLGSPRARRHCRTAPCVFTALTCAAGDEGQGVAGWSLGVELRGWCHCRPTGASLRGGRHRLWTDAVRAAKVQTSSRLHGPRRWRAGRALAVGFR